MSDGRSPPGLNEAAIVQNEALGAYALWRFGFGFQERDGHAATLPLAFLLLPLVLHGPTLAMVLATHKASGLHLFASKLGEQREDLIAVHSRCLTLRHLTLRSLMFAEQARLLRIDPAAATLWSHGPHDGLAVPSLPERIRRLGPACERVGYWFAGLSDQQVAQTLKIGF